MLCELVEYISLNNSINDHFELSPESNEERTKEIINTLCNFNNLVKKYDDKLTIFKIWFSFNLSKILYEGDAIIDINKNIIDLSSNYYLVLLIEKNENLLDYSFNLEYIQSLFYQIKIKKHQKYYTLILSKIILILVNFFLNKNDYIEENEEMTINDIKEQAEVIINNNIIFSYDEIIEKNIEEIYSMVIIDIIKKVKTDNYEETINIIEEIELDKIDITRNIFDEINKFFMEENRINDYSIIEEKDFENSLKINIYYILLKYIFKSNIFIYNFDLFLKSRNFIFEKIKSGYNISSFILPKNEYLSKRKEYIIEKLLDLDYCIRELKNNITNKTTKNDKTLNIESRSLTSESSPKIKDEQPLISIETINNSSLKVKNTSLNFSTNFNKISKWKIKSSSSLSKTNPLIRDSDNTNIIEFNRIINKNNSETKSEIDCILEFNSGFICWGTGDNIEIYDSSSHEKKSEINIQGKILNNIIVEESKDEIFVIVCFQDDIQPYEIRNLTKITKKPRFEDQFKNLIRKIFFILGVENEKYLVCFSDCIYYYYTNIFNPISNPPLKSFSVPCVIGAIKLDKNYIALKSCNIKDMKENKINFINISKQYLCVNEIKGYSFIFTPYGMSIMTNPNSQNNKILLCACKKYYEKQKNGILLINVNNLEDVETKIYTFFYDTEEFEVYCFCPIIIIKPKKIVNDNYEYIDTDYFLVGGFDIEKQEGCIKLFKIKYESKNKIVYVQDIDDYNGFKTPVNCIIQEKFNPEQKLLVTTLDGNIYLFSGPNIDYFLKEDKKIKDEVSFDDFFKVR